MAESEMNIDSKDQKAMPINYTKLEQAARQALEALEYLPEMRGIDEAIAALRKALAEPELNLNCKSVQKRLATVWGYVKAEQAEQEPPKNQYNHKRIGWELERTAQGESYYGNALYVAMDLPFLNKREKDCLHRYMHGSETPNDRFVLQDIAMKVYSEPEATPVQQAEQEQFDMEDHPPHRLCECRKCMEYFTPLPDCDAFADFGKPIAEQINTQFMEGYRIGLAEMREKCATVSEQGTGEAVQKATLELLLNERKRIALAIRATKFEGDTGFRPVSEMIAEHKQDPKKAAAIEKAKMRKAEREPVTISCECGDIYERNSFGGRFIKMHGICPNCDAALQAAPLHTKDLTDDEIEECVHIADSECTEDACMPWFIEFARAVIAKFKEKNK